MPESLLAQDEACNFIKKETLAQMFSRKICKIVNNTFVKHFRWLLLNRYTRYTDSIATDFYLIQTASNCSNIK